MYWHKRCLRSAIKLQSTIISIILFADAGVLQNCGFLWVVAVVHLLDGFSGPTSTERSKKFGGDDFTAKLCISVGSFYLFEVVYLDFFFWHDLFLQVAD